MTKNFNRIYRILGDEQDQNRRRKDKRKRNFNSFFPIFRSC